MKKPTPELSRREFLQKTVAGTMVLSSPVFLHGCAGKRINLAPEMAVLDQNPEREAHLKTYMDAYRFDACVECGACLHGCPFKDLTEEQAIDNINKMRQGDPTVCEDMLDQCCFCFKCNHRCPVDAMPTALMLQRLSERRKREGTVPSSLKYALNGMEDKGWKDNIFRDMYSAHSNEEKHIVEKWAAPKDCKGGDLLWCGCGVRMFPYDIEHSKVLDGIQKFGGSNDCCGLFGSRSGLNDVGRYVVNNLIDRLEQSNFNRLVVICGSCAEMFRVSMPHYIGQEFPFETITIYEYLDEQIQSGKLSVQRKVPEEERDACISDSCHGYEFGENFLAVIKRLYEAIGYDCVELAHNRENNACCGQAGYFRKGNIWGALNASKIKKNDIKKSGKKNILTYCQGCYIFSHLSMPGDSHYLFEKLLWALGDDIKYPQSGIVKRGMNFSIVKNFIKVGPSALF